MFTNRTNTIELRNVYNAKTSNFHVVAYKLICTTANYGVSINTTKFNNVISYKTMTTFNKLQSSFAFTNARVPCKQNAYTANLNKNPMNCFLWGNKLKEDS